MKRERSKLNLLKEVVHQITPQQQDAIKGGRIDSVPTAKSGTTKTR
jgi:hypothetical protein